MSELETFEEIATRNLYFLDQNGDRCEVLMQVGRPRTAEDPNEYFCPFRISGIGDERIRKIYGVDEVQALQLAMNAIGAYQLHLNREYGVTLRWEAESPVGHGDAPRDR